MQPKPTPVWPFALVGALALGLLWILQSVGDSEAADSIVYGTPLYSFVGAAIGAVVGLAIRRLLRWAAQQREL